MVSDLKISLEVVSDGSTTKRELRRRFDVLSKRDIEQILTVLTIVCDRIDFDNRDNLNRNKSSLSK